MANNKQAQKKITVTLKEIFTNKTVLVAIAITLFLLILFHLGSIITMPGIALPSSANISGDSFAGMLNLLAGGGMTHMSLFAVGLGPYITAQIIVQLLSSDLIKPMSKMAKLGERGRRKLEIITRFITLPFCVAQAYASLALILNNSSSAAQITIFGKTSLGDLSGLEIFYLLAMFTAGTYIAIFIGDIITKRGVGNGVTLLILAGILSSVISNIKVALQYIESKFNPQQSTYMISVVLSCFTYLMFFVTILVVVVFINGSTRKIPVQQTGQGLTSQISDLPFLPIKLNAAGVIPVIFASSIMTIPGTIAQFLPNDSGKWFIQQFLVIQSWSGLSIYFVLIIAFSFFYSYVQINPMQLAENFEKAGKFIPGVKNGLDTEKHITRVLNRIN
jgi:preprotein translocase subunit SecY